MDSPPPAVTATEEQEALLAYAAALRESTGWSNARVDQEVGELVDAMRGAALIVYCREYVRASGAGAM